MLRVAFIDQTGAAHTGGAQESLLLLLRHLPADIDPQVVLFEPGAYAERIRATGVPVHIVPLAPDLLAIPREHPVAAGMRSYPQACRALAARLRALNVDAVHTNSIKAHFVGAPAARLAGLPCVVHLRDLLDGAAHLALRTLTATFARERIATSNAVARRYRLGPAHVIANPVDIERYALLPGRRAARRELGLPPGTPLVGLVGRINRWKGHDRFLRMFAALGDSRAHAVIVGEARFRDVDFVPDVHALARDLGIADRVSFVPWLDDVRTAYAAIDVNCNCSIREPFGRTTIEAAAAGVPTISFDDGGAGDTIADGVSGTIVPAGDETAFAGALRTYIDDAALRMRRGHAARAHVAPFAAYRHAARVAAVLKVSAA
jgi:glycosyltransferase involved in cell wall biosynthesis